MTSLTSFIGKKIGKLLIISISDGKPIALCQCDCGNKKNILLYSIKYGLTKSCGCLIKEYKSLIGNTYGSLIVTQRAEQYKNKSISYLCKCECGKEVVCRTSGLITGKTTHCGCKLKRVKHLNRQLYEVWKGMKARCRDKKHIGYKIYGGKGVRVCDTWDKSFVPFYEWCIDNGWKDGMQIDKDIKGDGLLYSPETCCIVTRKANMRASSIIKMSVEKAKIVRESKLSNVELARIFNVCTTTISSIKTNKTWV